MNSSIAIVCSCDTARNRRIRDGAARPRAASLPVFESVVGGLAMSIFLGSLGLISDPSRTALLVRCGLNRRPVVSRSLMRRGAAGPTSLREGKLAVCAGRDPLARQACPAGSAGPDL